MIQAFRAKDTTDAGRAALDAQLIDPASLRYEIAGREYRIGTRVMTPEGLGTVTAFDPGADQDIGITLDATGELVWTDWRYADAPPAGG